MKRIILLLLFILPGNVFSQDGWFWQYPKPQGNTLHDVHILNSLKVYDILGRVVNTLVDKWQQKGEHKIIWSTNNLPSGLYFYRLQIGEFSETKKMILIR